MNRFTPWQWVLSQNGFKRYAVNTGWLALGQACALVVAFFMGAYIARYLGPGEFGALSYAISFCTLLSFLVGYGIDTVLRRELVNAPERSHALMQTALWLKLAAGVLTVGVINVVSLFVNQDSLTRLLVFAFSLSYVLAGFHLISIFFQARVEARKAIKIQVAATLLSTLIKLVAVTLGVGVLGLALLYVLDSIILACGLGWAYHMAQGAFFKWRCDFGIARILLVHSWPLAVAYIMITIYTKADQVLLRYFSGEAGVGMYAAAVRISEVLYFIPTIICASVFPALLNARNTDRAVYAQRLRALYWLMGLLAVAVCVPLFFLADRGIPLLFGEEYAGAVGVFKWYIWSAIPMFLITALFQYVVAEHATKLYMWASVLGAVTNVLLNLWLIPLHGLLGAAYATLISYSLIPLVIGIGTLWRAREYVLHP
jgi:O-antigen/teichoic acid export membrane protein